MSKLCTVLAVVLSFWCCFYTDDGRFIRGNPEHFEGWYDDETGEEQQVIWIDGERFVVDLDELTMIYYESELSVG